MKESTHRILIVDDDPDILRLLTLRLQAANYTVETAPNAAKALTMVATVRPHLVVTDLRMQGMSGLALFDTLHQNDPSLPVIILTAHGSIPDAVEATKRGVFAFLTKPFESKDLLQLVADALRISHPELVSEGESDESWRSDFVSRSSSVESMLQKAKLAAASDARILIQGESGTGKELLARAIHKASPRRNKPFIAINCSALPEALLESELFGHVKGSFTGAMRDQKGLFQAADGGTLLLDEIGDMPLSLQVKILRVLQERNVRPVGATQSIAVDTRIISATHRNLPQMMNDGEFREDLYYRLNVVTLDLPALSDRREDIPLLASHILSLCTKRYGKKVHGFSPEAMEVLLSAPWPGNIRQLQNIIEQAVVLSSSPLISAGLVQKGMNWKRLGDGTLSFEEARRSFERDYLVRLMQTTNGSVAKAARIAQRNRTDFYKLLERHELIPANFKTEPESQVRDESMGMSADGDT
jgi:two-component system response regulator GlrR